MKEIVCYSKNYLDIVTKVEDESFIITDKDYILDNPIYFFEKELDLDRLKDKSHVFYTSKLKPEFIKYKNLVFIDNLNKRLPLETEYSLSGNQKKIYRFIREFANYFKCSISISNHTYDNRQIEKICSYKGQVVSKKESLVKFYINGSSKIKIHFYDNKNLLNFSDIKPTDIVVYSSKRLFKRYRFMNKAQHLHVKEEKDLIQHLVFNFI